MKRGNCLAWRHELGFSEWSNYFRLHTWILPIAVAVLRLTDFCIPSFFQVFSKPETADVDANS